MLVYTTLFTLVGKDPKQNKYIDMFYIWFTYLKRYAGLGPNDCVGVILDEDTLDFMNSDGNQTFAYLSEGVPFHIEISVMPRPKNLSEGFAERYNLESFEQFTKHELNLHTDIDCMCIRNIHKLFLTLNSDFYVMEEIGWLTDDNHAGSFIKDKQYDNDPGFSAGWYAWKHSDGQRKLFETVSKGCLENVDTPFYTVDQPFYNYEIFKLIQAKTMKIHRFHQSTVAFNPFFFDTKLTVAYFANFAGEPGVEQCHFTKMFTFMCSDFSTCPHYPSSINIIDEHKKLVNINYYEKEEQDLAKKYIQPSDTVLELGARYGSVSCTINSILSCKTNQVSVEPDERVWEPLERNKMANNCEFNIVKGFVSSKKLTLTELNSFDGYGTTSVEDNSSTIPSFTLDEIQEKYKITFNVLVADCEGFLETFFDENPDFYKSLRLIIFEADCPDKCDYNKIRLLLKNNNFKEILGGFQNVWEQNIEYNNDTPQMVLDNSSYIMNPYTLLSYDCRKENGELPIVHIGKKCSIAVNCTFIMANHLTDKFSTSVSDTNLFLHKQGNPSGYSKGDIIIKNDVWIGANCTILDGITIGNGAVIAAGSVVIKNVPPYSIVGGNPAKVVKYRFSQDIINDLERIGFWDLSIDEIKRFDIHTKDINGLLQKIREYKDSIFRKTFTPAPGPAPAPAPGPAPGPAPAPAPGPAPAEQEQEQGQEKEEHGLLEEASAAHLERGDSRS